MNSDPTNLKRAIRKVKLSFAAMAFVLVGLSPRAFLRGERH
jgi:hypothetical protein